MLFPMVFACCRTVCCFRSLTFIQFLSTFIACLYCTISVFYIASVVCRGRSETPIITINVGGVVVCEMRLFCWTMIVPFLCVSWKMSCCGRSSVVACTAWRPATDVWFAPLPFLATCYSRKHVSSLLPSRLFPGLR